MGWSLVTKVVFARSGGKGPAFVGGLCELLTQLGNERVAFAAMQSLICYTHSGEFWPWVRSMRRRDLIALLGGAAAWLSANRSISLK
jgi:hypothetical protein